MSTLKKLIHGLLYTFYMLIIPAALFCAAGKDLPLILTDKPIPFDRTLTFYEVLSLREQYKHDVKRLADVASCALILKDNAQHKIDLSKSKEIRAVIFHLANFCCSQLSYHCCEHIQHGTKLSAKEKKALATLIHKSKTAIDCLPQTLCDALCLNECEDYECPASRTRFPAVRSFLSSQIVEKEIARIERKPLTCCFLPSGYLAQEYELLKALAKKGIDVRNVIIVDTNYTQVLRMYGASIKQGLLLSSKDTVHKDAGTYNKFFSQLSSGAIDTAFHAILKLDANLNAIEQFKKSVQILFPKFESLSVYAQAPHYISICAARPSERSDVLIGCDFKDESTLNFKTGSWETLWNDFHATQQACLKESGTTWRLTTDAPTTVYLKMSDAARSREWRYEIIPEGPMSPEYGFWNKPN